MAVTVEDAVEFYSSPEFQDSPSGRFFASQDPNGIGISLTQQHSDNVAAILRVVNAAFNIDTAVQRNDAAITLENNAPLDSGGFAIPDSGGEETGVRATVDRLLSLSNEESQDAIDVPSARSLHADAVVLLQSAIDRNNRAILSDRSRERKDLMRSAVNDLKAAKAQFGTGLILTMGEGNLLF